MYEENYEYNLDQELLDFHIKCNQAMENGNLIEITIKCKTCKDPFDTFFIVKDGQPYDFCCSIDCYKEYHSIENIRDRLIENILNSEEDKD